ncbi:MgtC/SapB transporter [Halobacteriales archaeon QS_8_69_26]|nr:MAG: MgtC/SapB transporter [Halobacteriales archaeon QS_8_69_26]
MFLGLEREWSQKTAGIRTFSLVALLGALFTILSTETELGTGLLVIGALLVIVQGIVLATKGLLEEDETLGLTTSVSMLVTYGVGVVVATGYLIEGVVVAVLSSLLLVLKRELHSIAWGLSRRELRSVTEFAILAFVVFPLLPGRRVPVASLGVSVNPQEVWAMVVTVAGIGIVNYVVVQNYGGRGIAVTGFFGGLASSTAVVGTMLDHVRQDADAASYAVAAILLADAAMALRNLTIAVAFTLPDGLLTGVVAPLGAVAVLGVGIAAANADWSTEVEIGLESPFSMRNALAFGGVFLMVVVVGAVAKAQFGDVGFILTAAITGLVSSAGATTSAVVLYPESLGSDAAVYAILASTATSIAVKSGLTVMGSDSQFTRSVAIWSGSLIVGAVVVTGLVTLLVT